jgi:hypothetical protein
MCFVARFDYERVVIYSEISWFRRILQGGPSINQLTMGATTRLWSTWDCQVPRIAPLPQRACLIISIEDGTSRCGDDGRCPFSKENRNPHLDWAFLGYIQFLGTLPGFLKIHIKATHGNIFVSILSSWINMHKCTCVPEMTPRWPSARLVKHWKAARRIHHQSVSSFMHRSHKTHRNGKGNHQVERCPFAFLPSCFFDTCSLMSCHFIVFSFGFHHAPPFSLVWFYSTATDYCLHSPW